MEIIVHNIYNIYIYINHILMENHYPKIHHQMKGKSFIATIPGFSRTMIDIHGNSYVAMPRYAVYFLPVKPW